MQGPPYICKKALVGLLVQIVQQRATFHNNDIYSCKKMASIWKMFHLAKPNLPPISFSVSSSRFRIALL